MKKVFLALIFISVAVTPVCAGEKSYFKYLSDGNVLKPFSFWNPLINTKDGKVKSKSFFQYQCSRTLPCGSLWNPLITIPTRKEKRGK